MFSKGGITLELSRCILKKDSRKLIMQGMIHNIPGVFLTWLKADLKKQIRNGYRIFYEGIRIYSDDDEVANYSEQELAVDKCRKYFDALKKEALESMDLTAQFSVDDGDIEGLEYPKNAINIDITYIEYIKKLTELLVDANVDCRKIIDIFESTSRKQVVNGLKDVTESLMSGKSSLKELDLKTRTLDYFRISNLVEVGYRDSVAAKKINLLSKKKKINKIYVHYGEFHIEGIIGDLVDKYGWKITKTLKIDTQNPTLR